MDADLTMKFYPSPSLLLLRTCLAGCVMAIAMTSSGCSTETAPLPEEEAKATRAYRLSHDRVDKAIETKDAKKPGAHRGH